MLSAGLSQATLADVDLSAPGPHERYASALVDAAVAETIAIASGFLGACADDLANTVDHRAGPGIHDRPLERLRQQVLARSAAQPAGEPV